MSKTFWFISRDTAKTVRVARSDEIMVSDVLGVVPIDNRVLAKDISRSLAKADFRSIVVENSELAVLLSIECPHLEVSVLMHSKRIAVYTHITG